MTSSPAGQLLQGAKDVTAAAAQTLDVCNRASASSIRAHDPACASTARSAVPYVVQTRQSCLLTWMPSVTLFTLSVHQLRVHTNQAVNRLVSSVNRT